MPSELVARLQEAPQIIIGVVLSPFLFLAAILIIVSLLRRRAVTAEDPKERFGVVPEVLACVCTIAPLFAMMVAWRTGAEQVASALNNTDPSNKASLLAAGISTQMNADAFVSLQIVATVSVIGIGLGFLIGDRLHREGTVARLAGGGGAFLMVSSLVILAIATTRHALDFSKGFAAVALADPNQKAELLTSIMSTVRGILDTGTTVSVVVLIAGVVLVAIALLVSKAAASRPVRAIMLSAAAVVASVVIVIEAQPFAAENGMPIKYSSSGELVPYRGDVTTPRVSGADPLERAPIVTITSAKIDIEGIVVNGIDTLAEKMFEMRKVDMMMHPGALFDGRVIFVVDKDVRGERLLEAVDATSSAGFRTVQLAFVHRGPSQERPLFGTQTDVLTTAIQLAASDDSDADTVTVDLNETFDAIAARLAAARSKGQSVRLVRARAEDEK